MKEFYNIIKELKIEYENLEKEIAVYDRRCKDLESLLEEFERSGNHIPKIE